MNECVLDIKAGNVLDWGTGGVIEPQRVIDDADDDNTAVE
jgi:hypothetical protein